MWLLFDLSASTSQVIGWEDDLRNDCVKRDVKPYFICRKCSACVSTYGQFHVASKHYLHRHLASQAISRMPIYC